MSKPTERTGVRYVNGFAIHDQDWDSEYRPGLISAKEEHVQPLRFLVADDSGVNRRVAAIQLEHQGHFVRTAADGQEALALLEHEQFDCVLMDVQMPGIDGLEATRRIRQREHLTGGHLPVLAMTADALSEDRTRYRAAGMDDSVNKPLDPRAAVSTACRVIEAIQARTHGSRAVPEAGSAPNF